MIAAAADERARSDKCFIAVAKNVCPAVVSICAYRPPPPASAWDWIPLSFELDRRYKPELRGLYGEFIPIPRDRERQLREAYQYSLYCPDKKGEDSLA